MKKSILNIAVCSLFLMSCSGTSEEGGDSETNVAPNVSDNSTEAITNKDKSETVKTLNDLPEGWMTADITPTHYLYMPDSVTQEEMANLSDHYALGFGAVYGHLVEKGLDMAGAPMVVWKTWDTTAYSYLDIALPVLKADAGNDVIKAGLLEAGPGLKYVHFGDYHNMIEPHIQINEWAALANVTLGGPWEVYATDPGMEPDTTKWQTEIWYPIIQK